MRLLINDESYDLGEALQGAALGDLIRLKKDRGIGVKSITDAFVSLGSREIVEALEDDTFLNCLVGMIWLARRKAGEDLTFEDAEQVSFTSLSFNWSDDEETESDPKDEAGVSPVTSAT